MIIGIPEPMEGKKYFLNRWHEKQRLGPQNDISGLLGAKGWGKRGVVFCWTFGRPFGDIGLLRGGFQGEGVP